MDNIQTLISRARVHDQWQPLLTTALGTLPPQYLQQLIDDDSWLPGIDCLLSAFQRDLKNVQYLLIGESPYPRSQSANGIAFYDAAVSDIWSDTGLSKTVNRATSMRNILKTALKAEGHLHADSDGKIQQSAIAQVDKTSLIKSMAELFDNFKDRGFLMLNATPVLHPDRKPAQEAVYWRDFLTTILRLIADALEHKVTLVLWGKIAEQISCDGYHRLVCEHPYNISFIDNPVMFELFRNLRILRR